MQRTSHQREGIALGGRATPPHAVCVKSTMQTHPLLGIIGRRVSLPGHFDGDVTLEEARPLGQNGSGGYECRVRLLDGTLEETILSPEEANAIAGSGQPTPAAVKVADPARLHLL